MRFCSLLCFVFAVAGVCLAQDSNFSTGPQYLMNYGSPQFLRPISTPSLSLSTPTASIPATEAVAPPETPSSPSTGSQSPADLARVYWGGPDVNAAASETSVIEVSGTTAPTNLPASIVNVGVQETADAQSLRERGYGVTVSEASSFWKTHKPHAARVFTNRDIERLHGG